MNDLTTVRTAMYTLLAAAPATYPVYAPVPQGVAKPFIAFGVIMAEPDEELQAATTDATVELNTWSATPSEAQTHAMLQFIRARLDGVTVSGAWFCSEDFVEIIEDPASTSASRLYHGVARYRVRVG